MHTPVSHIKKIFLTDSTTDAELSLKIYFTPLYEDIIGTENLQGHVSTVNSLYFNLASSYSVQRKIVLVESLKCGESISFL